MATKHLFITIDGPAAAGKTFYAEWIAKALKFDYLDTGCFYRGLTWWCIQNKLYDDAQAIIEAAEGLRMYPLHHQLFYVNNHEVTDGDLHTAAVNERVGIIARMPDVRAAINKLIHFVLNNGTNWVVVGRDAGTVILPDASHKFFITARPEVRIQRRQQQQQVTKGAVDKSLKDDLLNRDNQDQNRKLAPLIPANNAIIIDNSDLTPVATKQAIIKSLESWCQHHNLPIPQI